MPRHNKSASGADPMPTGELRKCPSFLNEIEKQCWAEFIADSIPGILKNADNWSVERYVRLFARSRAGTATAAEEAQITALSDRFGGTPKARPNVKVPTKTEGNAFAGV